MGDLRLKPAAFWRLTWRDYLMRAEGFHRRQIRKWQHTRYMATMLLNVNRDVEKVPNPIEPWEVLWLPGDPQPAVITPEELDAELARVAALDPDWL